MNYELFWVWSIQFFELLFVVYHTFYIIVIFPWTKSTQIQYKYILKCISLFNLLNFQERRWPSLLYFLEDSQNFSLFLAPILLSHSNVFCLLFPSRSALQLFLVQFFQVLAPIHLIFIASSFSFCLRALFDIHSLQCDGLVWVWVELDFSSVYFCLLFFLDD